MKVRFEFKLADFWIGVFWKVKKVGAVGAYPALTIGDVWICLLPCLPLHISWVLITNAGNPHKVSSD